MGHKGLLAVFAALALPLMATPATAQGSVRQGKGVNCMIGEYTADQRAEIAQLGTRLSDGATIDQAVFDQIGNIAMGAVTACGVNNGWTEEQVVYASLFELGRVNEIAYRASDQMTPDQLLRLDTALTTGNRDRLWEIIERSVMAGMGGGDTQVSNSDAMTLGAFIVGAGLDDGDSTEMIAEKVGLLLGFMVLQRIGRREFDALS